jgi:hypothetical protein
VIDRTISTTPTIEFSETDLRWILQCLRTARHGYDFAARLLTNGEDLYGPHRLGLEQVQLKIRAALEQMVHARQQLEAELVPRKAPDSTVAETDVAKVQQS